MLQKYNLTIECIDSIKNEADKNKTKILELETENTKLTNEKNQIKDFFTKQVDDLEENMNKVVEESEAKIRMIKELRHKTLEYEENIEKANRNSLDLLETNKKLHSEVDNLNEQLKLQEAEKQFKNDISMQKQVELEMELLKTKSKLDETIYELKEIKTNSAKQTKLLEFMKQNAQERELQYASLQESYKICYNENRQILESSSFDKSKFESQYSDLQAKMDASLRSLEVENSSLKKQLSSKEKCIEKFIQEFNAHQELIEGLMNSFKYEIMT